MENITKVIAEIDSRISVQDMEILNSDTGRAVFLTLLIPFPVTEEALNILLFNILSRLSELDASYDCVIAANAAQAALAA